MPETRIKSSAELHAGEFMAALLVIQPLLDVLSFFMQEQGLTLVTTSLRTVLLVTVSLYAFSISDRKGWYAVSYGAAAGFWLLHCLNCLRTGYAQPVGDAAEYLKLIQLPLWTQAFLTFFRKREGLDSRVIGVLAVNLALILGIIGLSYAAGYPVYTYNFPERGIYIGVLGWFGVPNAQSALLCLLVPAVMLWGLRSGKLWLFALCSAVGCGLLYATGTRLTFYTAVLACGAFLVIVFLCRKPWMFGIPLLVILALLLVFRGVSPMERRQALSGSSFTVYQEKIDQIMGEDRDFTPAEGEAVPEAVLEKMTRVYEGIYGKRGVYKEVLLEDLLERFGTPAILEKMNYSVRAGVLNNARTRKLAALDLVWEEQDLLTRMLGMEYAKATIGAHNYDPENDFPDLLYYYGYLGTALYAAFLLGIVLYGGRAFFRRFPALVTPEFLIFALLFVLGLGAAQLGGQVLRKPNVTVYISLAGAEILFLAGRTSPPEGKGGA